MTWQRVLRGFPFVREFWDAWMLQWFGVLLLIVSFSLKQTTTATATAAAKFSLFSFTFRVIPSTLVSPSLHLIHIYSFPLSANNNIDAYEIKMAVRTPPSQLASSSSAVTHFIPFSHHQLMNKFLAYFYIFKLIKDQINLLMVHVFISALMKRIKMARVTRFFIE